MRNDVFGHRNIRYDGFDWKWKPQSAIANGLPDQFPQKTCLLGYPLLLFFCGHIWSGCTLQIRFVAKKMSQFSPRKRHLCFVIVGLCEGSIFLWFIQIHSVRCCQLFLIYHQIIQNSTISNDFAIETHGFRVRTPICGIHIQGVEWIPCPVVSAASTAQLDIGAQCTMIHDGLRKTPYR